jgi:2-dehydro-3-deoxyphosphogluconate aldolase/(4S)-4-hydroxy-2-oxoglutarate aldolase
MSSLPRNRVIEEILMVGLIPVFYNNQIDVSQKVAEACSKGGANVLEFTNRGNRAHIVFSKLASWCDRELPEIILGTGTILDIATASLYINNGANFIVGPSFNPDVAKICNKHKVLYIPGCQTPTEISEAEKLGAEIIKLFPANVVTPKFIETILGPMPQTLIMPSGGVRLDREEITKWIKSGAIALNMGSDIIKKDLVEQGNYEEIKKNVQKCLSWIREARNQRNLSVR